MSNVIRFPLNKTRPSDNDHNRLEFNVRAVVKSEEFKSWLNHETTKDEFIDSFYKMLPRDAIPPSHEELEDIEGTVLNVADAKTEAGIRAVPVHSQLEELLKELIANSKDGYLLTGLSDKNKYQNRANGIGKAYGRMKKDLGFSERHSFHSLRSTVSTKLRRAKVDEGIAADIMGHDIPTITYGLYSGGSGYELMKEAIEKIKYKIRGE